MGCMAVQPRAIIHHQANKEMGILCPRRPMKIALIPDFPKNKDAHLRIDLLVYRLCASPKRNSQRIQSSTTESPFENLKLIRNGRNRRGCQLLIRLIGSDGPVLPTKGSDEFKPFIRRLPEFKFWYTMTKAFCIAFFMTFFSVFDVPVFWPILLCYWGVLFVLTMRRQIGHMIKYKYIPFNIGKQKYTGKKASGSSSGSRGD
ncbi:hypothetical protein V6N11_061679 [Hibiscus sabdariffa]|uniref:Retrieval of early ER protein Rer1 n=1 Tax=Hibiscus sabdariffa TaxID=183260 RepID=A0ABR1Z954_9ROSI